MDLKTKEDLKNGDDLKNEEDLKKENDFKNQKDSENEDEPCHPLKKLPEIFLDDFLPGQPHHN